MDPGEEKEETKHKSVILTHTHFIYRDRIFMPPKIGNQSYVKDIINKICRYKKLM